MVPSMDDGTMHLRWRRSIAASSDGYAERFVVIELIELIELIERRANKVRSSHCRTHLVRSRSG